jgi:hypothetical protein
VKHNICATVLGVNELLAEVENAFYRGETVRFSAQVSGPSDKTVTWSVPAGFGSIDIVVGGFELQDLVSPLATAELYQ